MAERRAAHEFRALGLLLLLALSGGAAPAHAQLVPGQLFVTEAGAGAVVEVSGGGDLSSQARFATGLETPYGLCLGPGGRLYVAEFASGQVTDISAGGDFTDAAPHADGLANPIDLHCTNARIWVTEFGSGGIVEVTHGGNFAAQGPFASTMPEGPAVLVRDGAGRLLAAHLQAGTIHDVSGGGDVSTAPPFAYGGGELRGLTSHGGALYVADGMSGQVHDVTAGGDITAAPVFATVPFLFDVESVPGVGLLALSFLGVFDISAGGDFTGAVPMATGTAIVSLTGAARVPACGNALLESPEGCDDGNTTDGDGCSAACSRELCQPAPSTGCIAAEHARLRIVERSPGRERWRLRLRAFDNETTQADFGDPVAGATQVDVCIYDESDGLVTSASVDRAGQRCGSGKRDCWRPQGERGFRYRDPEAAADGIRAIRETAGAAGKGHIRVRARNRESQEQMALPTGVASSLAGHTRARLQLLTDDGGCFEADLARVRRADAERFDARTP